MSMAHYRRRRVVASVSGGGASPALSVSIVGASGSVVQGATSTRSVTVTRTSFSDTVALAVSGLPTGVTGSLSPSTLTGGATSSTLTLSAAADAPTVSADAFTVTASGSGVSDATANATVTVQPASTPGAETVNFLVTRWDGNSGNVMVFGAVPLKPGALKVGESAKVVIRDPSGNEKQIAAQWATSRFPDATAYADRSMRALHVQFLHTVSNNAELVFTVEIGGASRTLTDLTWVEPIYDSATMTIPAMKHKATLMPDDSQYWCDTFAALTPQIPHASTASGPAKNWYDAYTATADPYAPGRTMRDFWNQTLIDSETGEAPAQGSNSAVYEHVHGAFAATVRAPNRAQRRYWMARFWNALVNQSANPYYLVASWHTFGDAHRIVMEWDSSLPDGSQYGLATEALSGIWWGWTVGYMATGWSLPKRQVCYLANGTWAGASSYATFKRQIINAEYLFRFNMHRQTNPFLAAYVIEATDVVAGGYGGGRNNDTYGYATVMPWVLDAIEEFTWSGFGDIRDGLVGQDQNSGDGPGSPPPFIRTWQLRSVVSTLLFYWNNISQDARIPTWVAKIASYLDTQLVFNGNLVALANEYDPAWSLSHATNEEWWTYGPFLTQIYGWLYAHTGNSAYKTTGDKLANEWATRPYVGVNSGSASLSSPKLLGEYFDAERQSYLAYVNGVGTTITGAQSTQSPINLPTRVFP